MLCMEDQQRVVHAYGLFALRCAEEERKKQRGLIRRHCAPFAKVWRAGWQVAGQGVGGGGGGGGCVDCPNRGCGLGRARMGEWRMGWGINVNNAPLLVAGASTASGVSCCCSCCCRPVWPRHARPPTLSTTGLKTVALGGGCCRPGLLGPLAPAVVP